MARKRQPAAETCPVAEGVRVTVGSARVEAVRKPSHEITVRVSQDVGVFRAFANRIPLLRGILRFWGSIAAFFSALHSSASLGAQPSVHGNRFTRKLFGLFRTSPQSMAVMWDFVLVPLILALMLYVLPKGTELILLRLEDLPRFAANAVCAAFRMLGLVLSIYILSQLKLFKRLSMYRGACAKVTNAREAYGNRFTHEHAVLSSRLTAKSDGAFMLLTLLITLAVIPFRRTGAMLPDAAWRLSILLITSAVLNEIIRPLERAKAGSLGASLREPYIQLEHLFTREPNAQVLEVAVTAMHAACENDLTET